MAERESGEAVEVCTCVPKIVNNWVKMNVSFIKCCSFAFICFKYVGSEIFTADWRRYRRGHEI